jgi:hypothetical protein
VSPEERSKRPYNQSVWTSESGSVVVFGLKSRLNLCQKQDSNEANVRCIGLEYVKNRTFVGLMGFQETNLPQIQRRAIFSFLEGAVQHEPRNIILKQ